MKWAKNCLWQPRYGSNAKLASVIYPHNEAIKSHGDFKILGSNLACLLLAEEYSASGQPVYWMLDGGTAGSQFFGLDLDGEDFNFGMVQIEQPKGHLATTQDIRNFKPTIYRDWLNYSSLINHH